MPKHPTPPIAVSNWFQDLASVQELRETLQKSSFQQAIAILKEIAGPTFNTLQQTDQDAQRLAWYAGYRDAFNDLEKLTKLPEDKRTSATTLNEWNHIE
tara:strand:- start:1814 stop:2110 length:297 start_codon:yes stop_codon:yes gene_type:complete